MKNSRITLVTGSAGRVGQAAVAGLLARDHAVRGFDRMPTPMLTDTVVGSVTDVRAVAAAMRGVHTLIHLAATPDDCADFAGDLVPNNIVGLYNVMEAAQAAGVRRLILASSGQVNDVQQVTGPWPIRAEDPPSPRWWYAATKLFMESAGYSFSARHGLSVIVARLGWCPRTRAQVEEIAAAERFRDVYFSPGDVGRFFVCTVEAGDDLRFAVIYGVSKPVKTSRLDLEPAKRLIGYEPRDQWPEGIEIVTGS